MNWPVVNLVRAIFASVLLTIATSAVLFAQLPTQAEYDALMEIYQSTGGPGWVNKTGWSTANPNVVQSVSGWYGVYTDANGHVTHLDLDGILDYSYYTNGSGIQEYPGNGLIGTIPASIGDLTWLQVLNLGGNNFGGSSLPTSLGNLTELVMFVSAGSQLGGAIPASIGNCNKLRYILLEYNQLTGPIPASVGNLTELWAIQLHYNLINGPVPATFGNLKKLVYFHLYGNLLSGALPPELGSMTAVASFALFNNQLTGSIPLEFGRLKNVSVLHLGSNQLTGSIPDSLSRLIRLSNFDVSNNDLSGTVPASLAAINTLNRIELGGNAFTFSDIQALKSAYPRTLNFGSQILPGNHTFWVNAGDSFTLTTSVDRNTNPASTYQWFKAGGIALTQPSVNGHTVQISQANLQNQTGTFYCVIRNSALHSWGSVTTGNYTVNIVGTLPSYIRVTTALAEGKTLAELEAPDVSDPTLNVNYTYFDGLGRPLQEVQAARSPTGQDIVTPITYDGYGRQYRSFLPFASGNNGLYKSHSLIIDEDDSYKGVAKSFYANTSGEVAADDMPYSTTIYEPSPLNRPVKTYGPGTAWSIDGVDKPVSYQYLTNIHDASSEATQGEAIIVWKIDAQGTPEPASVPVPNYVEAGGYYSSNQLHVKVTVDEEGHAVREYTNKQGQTILKKVQAVSTTNPQLNNPSHWAFTYYIYDDLDNLVFVLQPEGYKQYVTLGQP